MMLPCGAQKPLWSEAAQVVVELWTCERPKDHPGMHQSGTDWWEDK